MVMTTVKNGRWEELEKDSIITYEDVAVDQSRFSYQIRKRIEEECSRTVH